MFFYAEFTKIIPYYTANTPSYLELCIWQILQHSPYVLSLVIPSVLATTEQGTISQERQDEQEYNN